MRIQGVIEELLTKLVRGLKGYYDPFNLFVVDNKNDGRMIFIGLETPTGGHTVPRKFTAEHLWEPAMDNKDKNVTKQVFTQETLTNPPANHNPLIGMHHYDTLINVYDSLSTLQELTVSPPNEQLDLSPASSAGLYFLLCCIKDALRFEVDYRQDIKNE